MKPVYGDLRVAFDLVSLVIKKEQLESVGRQQHL